MEIVRWNPWREMDTFHNRINRFFDGSLFPVHKRDLDESFGGWSPAVDIYENDDEIVLKAELPGIDKKDIEVDLKDRVLTLKGERTDEKEVKEEKYYRKERIYGKFSRSFTIPMGVNPDKIKADFKDGVLKVEIPKPEEKKPKQISVH